MTEKEWKKLPLPTESPLVPYKRYRGSKVTWSSGKTAYYWVEYHFQRKYIMLECLIIGDSIGVGTKMFAPKECVSYSKGGYNTWQWNKRWGSTPLEAKTVVISLGTNDHNGVNTFKELSKVRYRIRSVKVVWIMPPCNSGFCKPKVNAVVKQIAAQYNDVTISTSYVQPDKIHPSWRGYKDLVKKSGI